jgi:hypothetical protein
MPVRVSICRVENGPLQGTIHYTRLPAVRLDRHGARYAVIPNRAGPACGIREYARDCFLMCSSVRYAIGATELGMGWRAMDLADPRRPITPSSVQPGELAWCTVKDITKISKYGRYYLSRTEAMRIYEILFWNNEPTEGHLSDPQLRSSPTPFSDDPTNLANAFTRDGKVKHFWNLPGS